MAKKTDKKAKEKLTWWVKVTNKSGQSASKSGPFTKVENAEAYAVGCSPQPVEIVLEPAAR